MISQEIPKEIQQPSKIIAGLTKRQTLAVGVCGTLGVVVTVMIGFDYAVICIVVFAVLAFFLGWYKKDGLTAEKLVIKILQEKFYKNNKRAYRTKNKYITLMNQEYMRRRNIDLSNKQIKKAYQKEEKKAKKRIKSTQMRAIQ